MEFDAQAGLMNPFGGGPRACFGKKMAYITMRVVFIMTMWNFKLAELPKELVSYDDEIHLTRIPKNSICQVGKDIGWMISQKIAKEFLLEHD